MRHHKALGHAANSQGLIVEVRRPAFIFGFYVCTESRLFCSIWRLTGTYDVTHLGFFHLWCYLLNILKKPFSLYDWSIGLRWEEPNTGNIWSQKWQRQLLEPGTPLAEAFGEPGVSSLWRIRCRWNLLVFPSVNYLFSNKEMSFQYVPSPAWGSLSCGCKLLLRKSHLPTHPRIPVRCPAVLSSPDYDQM